MLWAPTVCQVLDTMLVLLCIIRKTCHPVLQGGHILSYLNIIINSDKTVYYFNFIDEKTKVQKGSSTPPWLRLAWPRRWIRMPICLTQRLCSPTSGCPSWNAKVHEPTNGTYQPANTEDEVLLKNKQEILPWIVNMLIPGTFTFPALVFLRQVFCKNVENLMQWSEDKSPLLFA